MEALYNKYRPRIFEDVVGQEHIERTLKNAIASNKISHAYMFTGPRGTGKTTTARLLSKSLLCEKGPTPDPDGTCEDCELIAVGEHPDVYELDAASRTGVENVREEIIGKVDYAPTRGKSKVYIIDEVHMLSTAAFNALLKTLEEPPDHVVFILCTTDPQKVPETILSRCQRFDFRRISPEEMVSRLGAICEMEGIEFEGDALDLIAHRAQGGMRDALTSLEQLIAFGNGEVSMEVAERMLGTLDSSDLAEIVKAIGTRDVAECFNWTASYMETGADLIQFVSELTQHMRDMYVMSLAGNDVALDVTEAGRRELEVELAWYGPDRLARMLDVLGDLAKELKTSTNQRLSFEIALTRMVRPDSDITLASLAERIEGLERMLEKGVPVAANSPVSDNVASKPVVAASTSVDRQPTRDVGEEVQDRFAANAESEDLGAAQEEAAAMPQSSNAVMSSINAVPQDALQMWASVLGHLKKIGPAFGVIFMNTNTRMNDGRLEIEFSQNNDFSFKAANKQDARDALEKALEKAGYAGLPYQITKSTGNFKPKEADVSSGVDSSVTSASQASSGGSSVSGAGSENEPAAVQQTPDPYPVSPKQANETSAASDVQLSNQADSVPQTTAEKDSPVAAPFSEGIGSSSAPAGEEGVSEPAKTTASMAPSSDEEVPPWEDLPSANPQPQDSDPDFQDFLTSAFGEGIVFEEVEE